MRRILTGLAAVLVGAIATVAWAGNQDLANQIAKELRDSGKMSGYKIGVRCQDGVVWLRGDVVSEEQRDAALKLAFRTPGVARVVNELNVGPAATAQPAPRATSRPASQPTAASSEPAATAGRNPLRGSGLVPLGQNARRPQRDALARRLETAVAGGPDPKAATRVPTAYRTMAAERTAAQEEVPQAILPPQRARQMGPTYTATQQPCPHPTRVSGGGPPLPMYTASANSAGAAPARYDQPCMPNYAWPSYAAYPNYAALTYPKQYSPTAWPYIGPFYPYPQVPLGWRKVTLEWDSGWWFLDFKDQPASCWHR